ncbi:MAG: hypothetical protein AAF809_03885 [Bacteroidota bacterium]
MARLGVGERHARGGERRLPLGPQALVRGLVDAALDVGLVGT